MAKKKSYKSLAGLNKKLQSNIQSNSNLPDRISALEKELKDSITLAMSMIAVNKELIGRLQENEQSGTATKTDNGKISSQDTSADILSKIYGFFIKGSEQDKRNFELQRDFAEERSMESKRRKPSARRSSASKIDPKKPSSNPILDLLGFIGKGITGILGFIGGSLFSILSKGVSGIKDIFMKIPGFSILGKILGIVKDFGVGAFKSLFGLLEWSASLVGWLGTLGAKTAKIVFNILTGSAKLIFNLVWPLIRKVLSGVISKVVSFIPGLGESAAAEATGASIVEEGAAAVGVIESGSVLALPAATIAAVAAGGMVGSYLADKSDIFRYGKEWSDLRDKRNDIQQQISDLDKQVLSPERKQKKKEELEEKLNPLKGEMDKAALKHYKDVIAPAMLEQGYEQKKQDGKIGFFKKGGFNGPQGEHVDDEFVAYANLNEAKKEEGVLGSIKSIAEYPGNQIDSLKITKIAANYMMKKQKDQIKEDVGNLSDPNKLMNMVESSDTYKSLVSDVESTIGSPPPLAAPVSTPSTPTSEPPTAAPVSTPSAPVSTASTPAPLPSPPTAAPAPQSIPTPIPNLQSYDQVEVGKTEVVNLPTQTSASTGETDFAGTPNVRNPNPIVYRTAMRNDQAQP